MAELLAACSGKVAYPSKSAAHEALRRVRGRGRLTRGLDSKKKAHVYNCQHCGRFHIGSGSGR